MHKTNKRYYFAYGSNLSVRQMKRRCPHAEVVGIGKISNYSFAITGFSRRWNGGVATIIPAKNQVVWGVVYALDDHCLARLDRFEGVFRKRYARQRMYCTLRNGRKKMVSIYVREPRRFRHSSWAYQRVILEAAHAAGLPNGYIQDLKQTLNSFST